MQEGLVFKIKKYALHDGPGIRTTAFLKGCPLRCWWCHNPEGLSAEPQTMKGDRNNKVGLKMTADHLLAEIEKDQIFYDESGGGVTFSGGEPLMQPLFLETLLNACRQRGIHTAIDTSGHAPADTFGRLANLADLVLFDLKVMNVKAHRTYTGKDNSLILDNFKALCRSATPKRVRFPLVPGITDQPANLRAVGRFMRNCGAGGQIDLLPYHRIGGQKYTRLDLDNKMSHVATMSAEAIAQAKADFEQMGFCVHIGG